MNQHSSRSHAIFTIIVEQRSILECSSSNDVITAKFHLVSHANAPYSETGSTMSQLYHYSEVQLMLVRESQGVDVEKLK